VLAAAAFAALAGAAVVLDPGQHASACCPAYSPGDTVRIADQKILVVWDAENKTEHFVRQADFVSDADGFGFLVPTPTRPQLAEADAAVFARLEDAIRPEVKTVVDYRLGAPTLLQHFLWRPLGLPRSADLVSKSAGSRAPVRVLERTRVAGLDAAVLEADDPEALVRWLGLNGYGARPALIEWSRPYVEAGWKVTAFKYAAGGADAEGQTEGADAPARARRASTAAVRMSFQTDTPLFPYRVPTDQLQSAELTIADTPRYERLRSARRLESALRVFFVGPERVEGSFGEAQSPWRRELRYANARADAAELLAGAAPGGAVDTDGAWLTAFDDMAWPGGTEDLWFRSAEQQASYVPVVTRRRSVAIPLPLDVLAVGGLFVWLRRRRRS
jgi:hypothetical protein